AGEGPGTFGEGDVDDGVVDLIAEQGGGHRSAVAGPAPAEFDSLQARGFQGGVGLGQVVADAERAMQLVERGGTESGVGGGADSVAVGQLAPGGEAGADHLAGPGRIGLVKRRGTVRKVELAADAV